jgi:hypothetical protein
VAVEEVELGSWKGGADGVPVAERGEEFGPSTEWNEWHPSIRGKVVGKRKASVISEGDSELYTGNFFYIAVWRVH